MFEIFAIAVCLSYDGPCQLKDQSQIFFHLEDCIRARMIGDHPDLATRSSLAGTGGRNPGECDPGQLLSNSDNEAVPAQIPVHNSAAGPFLL